MMNIDEKANEIKRAIAEAASDESAASDERTAKALPILVKAINDLSANDMMYLFGNIKIKNIYGEALKPRAIMTDVFSAMLGSKCKEFTDRVQREIAKEEQK